MATINPDRALTLDRAEREALRRELHGIAGGGANLEGYVEQGDRGHAYKLAADMRAMFAVLDAVGWSEHPDAPDEQPVTGDLSAHTEWIGRAARELVRCLEGEGPAGAADLDSDLLAVAVLGRLAGVTRNGSPEVRARSWHLDLELLAREDRVRQNMPRRPGGGV